MLKLILPVVLALGGLGAGVGAGMALKPKPDAVAAGCGAGEAENGPASEGEAAPAATAPGTEPDQAAECIEAPHDEAGTDAELEMVSLDKPFVVPLFREEAVVGMVVVSLSVEVAPGKAGEVEALQPRLRDGFLAAMFRHANSGGFDGSFTAGQKMADLKSALRVVAQEILPQAGVGTVLVTEIVRQDV